MGQSSDINTVVDPQKFLTKEAKALNYGQLRGLVAQFQGVPGVIGLHGGLPPPEAFPFVSMEVRLCDGTMLSVGPEELEAGQQQYAINTFGLPSLCDWATQHTQSLHSPPCPTKTVVVGGASQGLSAMFTMFLERGDQMVVEEVSYPQMTECLAMPRGVGLVPIEMDGMGLCPVALAKRLETLRNDTTRPFPKIFYTVPTAQNPTGVITPLHRKREIYEVCRAFDILILEDDPYYYLQFPGGPESVPGLYDLPRASNYLSLDADGRVLRVDSTAKFLAPGLRLAWVTCSPALAAVLACAVQTQTLGACGVSQAIAAALLRSWGSRGLHTHLSHVQRLYAVRGAAIHAAAKRHLTGLAEWEAPQAGMFLWVRLLGIPDSSQLTSELVEARVVVAPGRIFHARSGEEGILVPCVRLAFCFESPENIEEAVARLGVALRQHHSKMRREVGA